MYHVLLRFCVTRCLLLGEQLCLERKFKLKINSYYFWMLLINLRKAILQRLDIKAILFRQTDELYLGKSLISVLVVGYLFPLQCIFFQSRLIHLLSPWQFLQLFHVGNIIKIYTAYLYPSQTLSILFRSSHNEFLWYYINLRVKNIYKNQTCIWWNKVLNCFLFSLSCDLLSQYGPKAFDTLNSSLLIAKLSAYGFEHGALKFFYS